MVASVSGVHAISFDFGFDFDFAVLLNQNFYRL